MRRLAAIVLLAAVMPWRAESAQRPDVVVILLDTVRSVDMSVYGGRADTTPHLVRLGHEGVVFERAVANGLWTFPSVATLLTGLLPSGHGVVSIENDSPHPDFAHRFSDVLDGAHVTLPEAFAAAGWRTTLVSSAGWYNGVHDFEQGFDEVVSFEALDEPESAGTTEPVPFGVTCRRSDARVFEEALARVRGRAAAPPTFLWLHLLGAHSPLNLPPEDLGTFVSAEEYRHWMEVYGPALGHGDAAQARWLDEDVAFRDFYVRLYAEVLRHTDALVGRFVDAYGARRPNTLFVVTSDHGEAFHERHMEHLHGDGVTPFAPLVEIPVVFHWAGVLSPRRVDVPIMQADLYPTLVDLAGLAAPPSQRLEGRSLAALARGQGDAAGEPPRLVVSEGGFTFPTIAVEQGGFKLVDVPPSSRAAIWQINRINPTGRHQMLFRAGDERRDVLWAHRAEAPRLRRRAHAWRLGRRGFHLVLRGAGPLRRVRGRLTTDSPVERVALRFHHPRRAVDPVATRAPRLDLLRHARTPGAPPADGAPGWPRPLGAGETLSLHVDPVHLTDVRVGSAVAVRYGCRLADATDDIRVRISFASPGNVRVHKCHDRVRTRRFDRLCVADSRRPLVLRIENRGHRAVTLERCFLLREPASADAYQVEGERIDFDLPLGRGWMDLVWQNEDVGRRVALDWAAEQGVVFHRWDGDGFVRVDGVIELGEDAVERAEPPSREALVRALRRHPHPDGVAAYLYRFGRTSNASTVTTGAPRELAPEVVERLEKLGYL